MELLPMCQISFNYLLSWSSFRIPSFCWINKCIGVSSRLTVIYWLFYHANILHLDRAQGRIHLEESPPNFSNIIKLHLKFRKFFKKYVVGTPPSLKNFSNIRFLPLNFPKIFKRNMVSPPNSSSFMYDTIKLVQFYIVIIFGPPFTKF